MSFFHISKFLYFGNIQLIPQPCKIDDSKVFRFCYLFLKSHFISLLSSYVEQKCGKNVLTDFHDLPLHRNLFELCGCLLNRASTPRRGHWTPLCYLDDSRPIRQTRCCEIGSYKPGVTSNLCHDWKACVCSKAVKQRSCRMCTEGQNADPTE